MTVLVGIYCKDGVVIGADSSATFGVGQIRTIEQPTEKISIISESVIVAGTGQVGLGQRFVSVVETLWQGKKFTGQSVDVGRQMCAAGIGDFASTEAPKGRFGALVAFPSKGGKHNLCEFAIDDFQPELKTEKLWYCSMGSGQMIVDPFLGLMRRVFWNDGPPTCRDGVFAVTWAIQHAIELNPGGVNGPIKIATLCSVNGSLKAKILTDAETNEHIANVEGAVSHLREYSKLLQGTSVEAPPTIPTPNLQ